MAQGAHAEEITTTRFRDRPQVRSTDMRGTRRPMMSSFRLSITWLTIPLLVRSFFGDGLCIAIQSTILLRTVC